MSTSRKEHKKTKTKPRKAAAKSKPRKAATKSARSCDIPLEVGMQVSAQWRGDDPQKGHWFPGKIVSIDTVAQTAHVKFADGDEDDALKWCRIAVDDGDEMHG